MISCRWFNRRHLAERIITAAGTGWKCSTCEATALTELELMGDEDGGFVPIERVDQRKRLHGSEWTS